MDFNFDLDNNVDEDFFGSLKSNKSLKLQQLFGEEVLSSDDKQQTLKYQRPKANDLKNKEIKDVAAATRNISSVTLLAKVVTAYKQGELQGKVGMALIHNTDDSFNIIMYKTKVYILTTLKLQKDVNLLYKQTKYWQFYDEDSIYWSFSFDSLADEEEFVTKLEDNKIIFKESIEEQKANEKSLTLAKISNKSRSITKKLPSAIVKDSKNSLIQRVAKVGKPLPTLSAFEPHTTTEYSDSSDTEVIQTPLASMQKPSIAPRNNKLISLKANQHLVPSIGAPATTAVYSINNMESQYMQMLLTEQRTQGSELRMNMNKLENKIEKVLDKLDLCDRAGDKPKPEKDDEILELEEKLLTIKKENRKLKQNLQELSNKETENSKTTKIIKEFSKDLMELDIDYKQDLESILTQLTDKIRKSIKIAQELQEQVKENQLCITNKENDLDLRSINITELQNELSLLKQKQNDLNSTLKEKELEIIKQKQDLNNLQTKVEQQNQESFKTPDNPETLMKSIMNNLYVDINDKLENANLPQSEQILAIIATSIRQQTLKSLQNFKGKE